VVVAKLEWFRAGGESSERQWTDVVGLPKTQGPQGLDRDHLVRWARAVGVHDLLVNACGQSGWE
jgi:hypothetical protein